MSALWTKPFYLEYGKIIYAQIVAINERGESIPSLENSVGPTV
jgi:hypothetical protein